MSSPPSIRRPEQRLLERFMWLSIAAAVVTIGLKVSAAVITGSVGFLSDALESGVNLVAAVVGLVALKVAARPADHNHHFGHGKAEYVSALVEGAMIFVAAALIIVTSTQRLFDPQPLEQVGLGLVLTILASVLNLVVGLVLLRAGTRHRSATLSADGQHLLTDVWTSAGVLVGIAAVAMTGWYWLDPVIALAVGANILWTGYRLLRQALSGLLSVALPVEELEKLTTALVEFRGQHPVTFAQPRTVESGRHRHIYLVMGVPAHWSVAAAHDVADRLEEKVDEVFPGAEMFIHIEPHDRVHAD
ncbi:cation diffusion facilitator family transporter [Corynebacterium glutamicum]|uniref:cation diffusion facilitator family transporter n=1 Tax=Corynebacterium glutamicum TaxID=1718 RepID=UPI001C0C5AD8|nr:cation diffusion facilitator family transporter [Corynebacterium glutamicum]QWQ85086.1 cation-efflux pump [Corynebacterium glutamicum]